MAYNAYFQILMIWQCHAALVRYPERHKAEDIRAARDEACEIQSHLDSIQAAINDNGGNMTVALYQKTLDAWELDNICEGPDLKLFRVDPDGVVEVEDRIRFYGGPYYIEAIYKEPSKKNSRTLDFIVKSDSLNFSRKIMIYLDGDSSNKYKSENFYLMPDSFFGESLTEDPKVQP